MTATTKSIVVTLLHSLH